VFQETRVHKVQKDRKDLREVAVQQDQVELDQPGHRVPRDLKVSPGQQDRKDLQVPEVLVVLAHRDHKVFPARLGPQVQ
jgi:hypothetical protein